MSSEGQNPENGPKELLGHTKSPLKCDLDFQGQGHLKVKDQAKVTAYKNGNIRKITKRMHVILHSNPAVA